MPADDGQGAFVDLGSAGDLPDAGTGEPVDAYQLRVGEPGRPVPAEQGRDGLVDGAVNGPTGLFHGRQQQPVADHLLPLWRFCSFISCNRDSLLQLYLL